MIAISRKALVGFVLILCLAKFSVRAETLKKRIFDADVGLEYLHKNTGLYHELQQRIFHYAEPGYQEVKSSKAIAELLEKEGFSIQWGVAGIPTAFVATYGSTGTTVGILGEYDALTKMSQAVLPYKKALEEGAAGHSCAHNLIGTASAAAAVAISKWLKEGKHPGQVKYFGCPAEEGGGGKYYMTREGCFDGCDVIFDWHPDNVNKVSLSPWQANMRVTFTFKGRGAHAGGAPWDGRSALDAVECFDIMMNMMREHVPEGTRIHYIITKGGEAPNAVPALAQVVYYFRHRKASVVKEVFNRALDAAKGAAMGTQTEMEYEIVNACYEKLINKTLSEIFLQNLQLSGGVTLSKNEQEYVNEILENTAKGSSHVENPLRVYSDIPQVVEPAIDLGYSTDVGNVSQMVPTATLNIALLPSQAGTLHSWQMAAVAGSSIGTKVLTKVAEIFYLSAVEIYTNEKELKLIKDEFLKARGKNPVFVPLTNRKPPLDYATGISTK
ncbi:MAG: amidohydrolase [Alistipes sp.]|nr:amidohydrolase [Candidatus Alistipes equi]